MCVLFCFFFFLKLSFSKKPCVGKKKKKGFLKSFVLLLPLWKACHWYWQIHLLGEGKLGTFTFDACGFWNESVGWSGQMASLFFQQEVNVTVSKLCPANHSQAFLSQERMIAQTRIKDSIPTSSVNRSWVAIGSLWQWHMQGAYINPPSMKKQLIMTLPLITLPHVHPFSKKSTAEGSNTERHCSDSGWLFWRQKIYISNCILATATWAGERKQMPVSYLLPFLKLLLSSV